MTSYSYGDKFKIHGVLMLLGWGFFIPVATFVSAHLARRTHRHREFGVHFHMVFSGIGVILALAGFGFGIQQFNTLEQKGVGERTDRYEYAHAVIGTLATVGMILQVLWMAIMRPPKDENDTFDTWPMWRKIGNVGHRATGFLSLYLAFVCMEMGTHLSDSRAQKYSAAFIGTVTAAILVILFWVRFAIHKYGDGDGGARVGINKPKDRQVKIELEQEQVPANEEEDQV